MKQNALQSIQLLADRGRQFPLGVGPPIDDLDNKPVHDKTSREADAEGRPRGASPGANQRTGYAGPHGQLTQFMSGNDNDPTQTQGENKSYAV